MPADPEFLFISLQSIGIILSFLLSAWLAYKQHRAFQVDVTCPHSLVHRSSESSGVDA